MSTMDGAGAAGPDSQTHILQIYPRLPHAAASCCTLQATAEHTTATVIQNAVATLGLDGSQAYSLWELRESGGEERPLEAGDRPVERLLLWPPEARKWHPQSDGYCFILQNRGGGGKTQVPDKGEDYDDLCNLPALTDDSILEALKQRFYKKKIYTYARSILIAINPYKFLPVYYNPKYVKMYENQPLGKLSPHIFAIADVAYRAMLNKQANQCIVISGESGSGKTESTSYLVHCLTTLSQKHYSSGVERPILGASPVLEAFGNAKTAQNNNSSRFGNFMKLNYLESGVIRGAVIEKHLLEEGRLVFRDESERNFHVFYYLLAGASKEEQKEFQLLRPQEYLYLKQEDFCLDDEEKLQHQYKRLHQAMEMVGFLASTKKQIFSILSAILYLGNVTYSSSEDGQALDVGPADVLSALSSLLKVKREPLVHTLTNRKTVASNGSAASRYTVTEASKARDSMAMSLYGALFDWIVLHINHALLNRRDAKDSVSCLSIGVLDIFGFQNLQTNSFEQFCINFASEKLQHHFIQHVFKQTQEEYVAEGIRWQTIDYTDNTGCLDMLSGKPTGVFHLLDEESNLPQASDDTLLEKLKLYHESNPLFVATAVKEPAFVIQHFAGRVKYQITDFLKKNTARMRPDVVSMLRGSERAFLRQLVASSPVAVFRWGILRATVRILAIFNTMGRKRAEAAVRRSSFKSMREMRGSSTGMGRLSSYNQTLDFSFDRSDEHPLDVFEDIFANYEKRRNNRGSRQKQLIPKNLVDTHSLKHIVALTSHNRTATAAHHRRLKPPSLNAQFQASFSKLLDTIGKAEPFFIRCIHSNAAKGPQLRTPMLRATQHCPKPVSEPEEPLCSTTAEGTKQMHFDADLVLQQIKSTGLVEVVRIQQAGFGAKFTFKEFVTKFRILLPKGARGAPEDITELLQKTGLDRNTYQIGKTKVFLKERERQRLQDTLNKEVMRHIVILQRWFRCCLIRTHFLQKKDAARIIQRSWRGFYETNQSRAAMVIQTAWRTSQKRRKDPSEQDHAQKTPRGGPGRQSVERKELKRQQGVELIPSRNQQTQKPKPHRLDQDQDPRGGEKWSEREGRESPPPLNRPLSLPMDPKHGGGGENSSSLQRYNNTDTIREMGNKWRERRSEGEQANDSSPENRRPRNRQKDGFQNKGKSMSVDELSKLSSSGSDSSPSTTEVRLRSRKRPPRRRRLAYARSGLMFNLAGSKESEFWSYPLPPISPQLKGLASSVDVRAVAHRHEFKVLAEPDGSRFSLPVQVTNEGSGRSRSQPTTGLGFFSRFMKKRATRDSQILLDKDAPLGSYSPQPSSGRTKQHPTVRISRATRAEHWNASLDREITDGKELRNLDEFLGNQVNDLHTRMKDLSDTEHVFLMATKEFRDTIKSMYSVLKPQICYKDLMKGYENKVSSLAGSNEKTEVALVVNLFQSVLDGFIRRELKRGEADPVKSTKKTKKRRKREKCMDNPLDHMFSTYQVNIMQSCDLCGSFIWGMEKAYMCSACKLICHKKCLSKVITDCLTRCARKDDSLPGSLHFGVRVCVLTSDAQPVPKVVEMLLMHVEMHGLYSEGIYRKSGSACRARELHQILETNPEEASLENYPIHTITGLVKRWLRELPDPLMTFTLYKDFLHAAELPEQSERIRAVYQKVDELPVANFNTLERLIFHLVKVAKEEEHNRMTPNSLAIVFAPCVLRSPDLDDPFLGIKDVSKTTMCLEILITEQFRRYEEKMHNIKELEYAETLAVNQLKLRRKNTIIDKPTKLDVADRMNYDKEAEESLIERIQSIKQEKEDLACRLPELEQEQSDNDNLDYESSMSSDSLAEDHLGSLDSEDLWQRVRCSMVQAEGAGGQAPVKSHAGCVSDATGPLCPKPGQDRPSASFDESQVAGSSFNGGLDDLDIPFIDDDL